MARYGSGNVYVRVHYTVISTMFLPAGSLGRAGFDAANSVASESRRFLRKHRRSGALINSIHADRVGSNQNEARFSVYTNVPYALFVNSGTRARITPRTADAMVLYQGPRKVPAKWLHTHGWLKTSVKGQKKVNFLERGLRSGLRKHGLL